MPTPKTIKLNEQAVKRGFKSHNEYLLQFAKQKGFNSYNEYQVARVKAKGFKSIHCYRKGEAEEEMSLESIRKKYGINQET